MRDLVKEGREILEKFSKLNEVGEDDENYYKPSKNDKEYYDDKDAKNKKTPEEEEDSEETKDQEKPKTVKDANVVLDNNIALITTPRSIQHVKDISKDTKWMMVGGTFYGTMFDKYKKEKYTTYFIQLKPKSPAYNDRMMRKIAVIISPSNQITAYDAFDGMIDIAKVYKITNTSRNLYKKLT
jgi:hypothetical protein